MFTGQIQTGGKMTTELKCADKVQASWENKVHHLTQMRNSPDMVDEEGTEFNWYGLCFDLVEAWTWEDQPNPYYRYQISVGGPQEEIRYHQTRHDGTIVEYWYLDWFDGACITLTGDDRDLALWVYEMCHPEE
jgi:hypothetical protein